MSIYLTVPFKYNLSSGDYWTAIHDCSARGSLTSLATALYTCRHFGRFPPQIKIIKVISMITIIMKGREAKWYNPKLSMGNGLKCSENNTKNYIIITKANVRKLKKNLNHQQLLKPINSQIDIWLFMGYIYHFAS